MYWLVLILKVTYPNYFSLGVPDNITNKILNLNILIIWNLYPELNFNPI